MKKRNIIFYFIWLLILILLQPTLIQAIKIFGVTPDLFLIFVVLVAMKRGKFEGAITGFIFGLIFDINVGRMIGLSALLYMYIGLACGFVIDKFSDEKVIIFIVLTISSSLLYEIFYYVGYAVLWNDLGFGTALLRTILPKMLYTVIVGSILFIPIKKSFNLIDERLMY